MLHDVAIIGGGITGLWLLNLLRDRGYQVVLVEKSGLGSGQTLASQGIIHGGVKYTLSAAVTPLSQTTAGMPQRWRDCLAGRGDIDLQSVKVLSDKFYLFTDQRLSSKITAFLGSKALSGKVKPLSGKAIPAAFNECVARLYQLEDLVLDTASLLAHLATRHSASIYAREASLMLEGGTLTGLDLASGAQLHAATYILAAGKDNAEFAKQLDIPVAMQLRPLHQVVVKGSHLPPLFAHAVTLSSGTKPALTITSHQVADGKNVWYLGGALAETGVSRSPEEQRSAAQQLLTRLVPWVSLDDCEISTWRVDRAEAAQTRGQLPDSPLVHQVGNVLLCLPTKMTLVPLLGDMVLQQLGAPLGAGPSQSPSQSPHQSPSQSRLDVDDPLSALQYGTLPWAR